MSDESTNQTAAAAAAGTLTFDSCTQSYQPWRQCVHHISSLASLLMKQRCHRYISQDFHQLLTRIESTSCSTHGYIHHRQRHSASTSTSTPTASMSTLTTSTSTSTLNLYSSTITSTTYYTSDYIQGQLH